MARVTQHDMQSIPRVSAYRRYVAEITACAVTPDSMEAAIAASKRPSASIAEQSKIANVALDRERERFPTDEPKLFLNRRYRTRKRRNYDTPRIQNRPLKCR